MKSTPSSSQKAAEPVATLHQLPGDPVRQILWRFADRPDLERMVQSVRATARGPVARLVAEGARHRHEWNEDRTALLAAFDAGGLTSLLVAPEHGGYLAGPKNLAVALAAFELAWVDGGAAGSCLAAWLGLLPILLRGTAEQQQRYLARSLPGAASGQARATLALTEPLGRGGAETGTLSGKVRVAEWKDGHEPMLQVDKRGRHVANMDFANVVIAAVESADQRLAGSCMVILEATDPGTFDRGTPTRKLVHQMSSTRDPVFDLRVSASRIVGGYTVQDGVIVPNFTHAEIAEAVFRRSRVPVGLMTSAKLLSAVEPILRYQRGRFRHGEAGDSGLQQKADVLQRLVDIQATGEASAALGFAAARLFDEYDVLEKEKERLLAGRGIRGERAQAAAVAAVQAQAIELLKLEGKPAAERDTARLSQLRADPLVRFSIMDAMTQVLCPATKLWNTGNGANLMREAVSLMGSNGITEDCPGFLGQKWMDAQLDATYEGPEAVQRRQLALTMTHEVFLAQVRGWVTELKQLAGDDPGHGACTLGSAFDLWLWTLSYLQHGKDADGKPLFEDYRQGVTFPMTDALCWLLAARCQLLDMLELAKAGRQKTATSSEHAATVQHFTDLCRVHAARAAGEVGRICTGLVFGYQRHPRWDDCGACFHAEHVQHLEETMPGIEGYALAVGDVIGKGGSHAPKAGPCMRFTDLEVFEQKRKRLDGCLVETYLTKDRAAQALSAVAIPAALDYPR